MFCLTIGYFIYDLSIITYLWRIIGGKAEVFFLVHHIMAICGLSFVVVRTRYILLPISSLRRLLTQVY
jgi:hypothetical protein